MKARPDILWIVTTQWRAQACGYAGDPNARTPHLDALAAQSINYTQAVTPHPFGPFARAALLTGVPSPANGLRGYFDPLPRYVPGAVAVAGGKPPGRTIAHELGERGYDTGFLGKWHLAARDPEVSLVGEAHAKMIVPPADRGGFEFWEGFESGFLLNDPWLHGSQLEQPRKFAGYQSDVLCARAAEWLGRREAERVQAGPGGGRPWFCVVSLEAPHPPYDAPAAGVRPRDPGEIVLPANVSRGGEVEARARRELAGYYAHIEATDRAIGRLLADVDRAAARSGREPPHVVVTSVHGDMHGAHGLFRKGWPYEEAVRVLLLVRTAAPAAASAAAVSLADLAEMALAWADRTAFEVALVGGARISMPSVVALPHQCDRVWHGWRVSTRKLVLNPDGSPWLFFDLENDPGEAENLAGDPGWAREIAAWRDRIAAHPPRA